MAVLCVSPLHELEESIRTFRPTHVISILGVGDSYDFKGLKGSVEHLLLIFNDMMWEHPDGELVRPHHIAQLRAFIDGMGDKPRVVVHCVNGVGRSSAIALTVLSQLFAQVEPDRLAHILAREMPHARPNRLVLEVADRELGLGGRLIAAARHFPAGLWQGKVRPVTLAVARELGEGAALAADADASLRPQAAP